MSYLDEVAESLGGATRRGEDILDTGEVQSLLGHAGGDDAGPPGRGNHAHGDGAALADDLAGHGVRLADLVAPVAPPDRHDRELGEDDGAADGRGHLLGALDPSPTWPLLSPTTTKALKLVKDWQPNCPPSAQAFFFRQGMMTCAQEKLVSQQPGDNARNTW
jgi:hypothetical protein